MSEPIQIRRSIQPSEYVPVFDTAFLLDPDYCFVPHVDFSRPVAQKMSRDECMKKAVRAKSDERVKRDAEWIPLIKEMKAAGMSNKAMSHVFKVGEDTVGRCRRRHGI